MLPFLIRDTFYLTKCVRNQKNALNIVAKGKSFHIKFDSSAQRPQSFLLAFSLSLFFSFVHLLVSFFISNQNVIHANAEKFHKWIESRKIRITFSIRTVEKQLRGKFESKTGKCTTKLTFNLLHKSVCKNVRQPYFMVGILNFLFYSFDSLAPVRFFKHSPPYLPSECSCSQFIVFFYAPLE